MKIRGRRIAVVVSFALSFALSLAVLAANPRPAAAEEVIKEPGEHPTYTIEGEPHLLWGWTHYAFAGSDGIGLGGRLSFPITDKGFIPTINNSVGITVGLDWLHYSFGNCVIINNGVCLGGADTNFIFIPVAMQWNFFVAKNWSVFGEPGFAIYHGFYSNPCDGVPNCAFPTPTTTGIDLALYVGGRYHFNEHIALVLRIGYPTFSFGVSFM